MFGATARAVRNGIVMMLGTSVDRSERLRNAIHPVALPLDPDPRTGFKLHHQYRGSTGNVDSFSCHVSTLAQGHCPHPPHTHPEEEILIVLQGEAEVALPSRRAGQQERRLT